MAFLRLLKRPHLALLWLSQVLSSTGDTFYTVALIWTAVNVAGSSAGVVVAAGFATRVLFGPIGGVLADRWDHRQTLIGLDVTRAITVASLPLIHATGSLELWHLIVVSILLAAQSTIFDPALQASLPGLIKNKDDIVAMNGLMDGTRRLALALAPSLAGALVALMPLAQFFTLDALSFCVSAVALIAIGRHFAKTPATASAQTRLTIANVFGDVVTGVRLVRTNAILSWFLVNQAVSNAAWAATFNVGAALLASRTLGGEVGTYGLILGAYGAGNILSNFVIGNLSVRRPSVMLSTSRLVQAAGIAIIAVAPSLPVAMAGSFLTAIGGPMGDLMLLAVMHRDMPQGTIGKVYALRMTISSIGIFVGLMLAGPLYANVAIRTGIGICAVVMAGSGIAGFIRFGLGTPTAGSSPRRPSPAKN